ncbi:MAG: class I SAM-dependent methyltransferase [Verrucomicrobiae bacterium]|nr:class I SAM-dependent methyltransferase [Verrucomicrobiae bacterium]
MPLPRITELAHYLVGNVLREGDWAIDATAGNGHDTQFLASHVGSSGRVDSFDVQEEAIRSTRERTSGIPQVNLHALGHEHIQDLVSGPVQAIMFNLGYLPSGNKMLITKPESTLTALESSMRLLDSRGIVTVIVYPAHPGGESEALCVNKWFASLPPSEFRVWHHGAWPTHTPSALRKDYGTLPPYLLAFVRR